MLATFERLLNCAAHPARTGTLVGSAAFAASFQSKVVTDRDRYTPYPLPW
jgi:hypothetical protein